MSSVDEPGLGTEAHTEAVLAAAMHKRAHGPKVLIPGLHGSSIVRQVADTVPVVLQTRQQPTTPEPQLGELKETAEVVHPEASPNIPLPERLVPTVRVVLSHQGGPDNPMGGFDLELEVTDICVDDESISMALLSGARFKPKSGMRFNLMLNNQDYPIAFVGGAFHFPRLNLNGLSFVRLSE